MTTFDERENAFESHFAFEEELDFRVKARRDRLVAEWAGGLMGLEGDELETYVVSVIRADLREPGDHEIYQKVLSDFGARNVSVRPTEVRERIEQLQITARDQLGGDQHADRVDGG